MTRKHTFVILIVGGRGTGKTTFTQELIEKSLQPRKLVLDTFHHPSYHDWPVMDPEQLHRWKRGKFHLHGSDTDNMIDQVNLKVKNCLIVFEDAAKMVNENPQLSVKQICLDSKQKRNDVIFIYHSYAEVPPKLLRWCDYIEVFKTQEVIANQKSRISIYERLLPVYQAVLKDPSKYAHQTFPIY